MIVFVLAGNGQWDTVCKFFYLEHYVKSVSFWVNLKTHSL
jgi:hypothetical protein